MKNHFHNVIAAILILMMFSACRHKPTYQELIIGSWNFSNERTKHYSALPPYPLMGAGFSFINDSVCENKSGYLKYDHPYVDTDWYQRKIIFLGNKTKYLFKDDSLKIWNLANHNWDSYKISKLTKDTLAFVLSDSVYVKFTKTQSPLLSGILYDQVIVSSSGRYGACPINNVLLKSSGQVIYYGRLHNTTNGLFTSVISKNQYNDIEQSFGNANLLTLKDDYDNGGSDQNTITTTFIKNGKIIKQIRDYGQKSPADLQFAYTPVVYFYQHLKLTGLPTGNSPYPYLRINFENRAGQQYHLGQSEAFYLWSILKDSPLTQQRLIPKYIARFYTDSVREKIETDGRIFKYTDKQWQNYDLRSWL